MHKTLAYGSGSTLSYAETGRPDGFPILVQHGMIASIDDTHLFHLLVETGARVICPARPGYGASSPDMLENIGEWGQIVSALVVELGLAQFDVFGISSGAPYSYAIGYTLPETVRRIYILSGTPALFHPEVQAHWQYPLNTDASLADLQELAYNLFFAHIEPADRCSPDIRDSLANNCFGIAQDLKIRCRDWGFPLSAVHAPVIMRHSKDDPSVPAITAEITARLLPDCRLDLRDHDDHFSQAVLDDFIHSDMENPNA